MKVIIYASKKAIELLSEKHDNFRLFDEIEIF